MSLQLVTRAWCVQCQWTTTGDDADAQAVAHLKSTGHAVGTKATPIEPGDQPAPIHTSSTDRGGPK